MSVTNKIILIYEEDNDKMMVTPFAVIIFAMYFFAFLKKKTKDFWLFSFAATIIITTNIRMGYFLRVGSFELNYASVLMYTLGITSLLIMLKNLRRFKTIGTKWYVVFLIVLFIGYVLLALLPVKQLIITGDWEKYVYERVGTYSTISTESVKIGYYLMFVFSGLSIIVARNALVFDEWKRILSAVIKFGKVNIVVGYIEWFFVNIFHSKIITNFFIIFFGSAGAQQTELTKRGILYTIQGATKEPSMYTTTVFYFCIILLVDFYIKKDSRKIRWVALSAFLLLINPAMSSFVYIAIIMLVLYTFGLLKKNKQKTTNPSIRFIMLFLFGFSLVGFLWGNYEIFLNSSNYMMQRIGIAFQQLDLLSRNIGYATYTSEGIRFTGIMYDLGLVQYRPLFGYGLGSLSCNSGIITLLANCGIIGITTWFLMILNFCRVTRKEKTTLLFLLEILVLPNLMLNDYETILCLIIPFATICYSYGLAERNKTIIFGGKVVNEALS